MNIRLGPCELFERDGAMTSATTEGSAPQHRLDGWKSIAQYLHRSSRTVQRWHDEYNLPIYRVGGGTGSVFAYSGELDNWIRTSSQKVLYKPQEISGPVLLQIPSTHEEPVHRQDAADLPLVSGSAKARSAELVAHAYKLWKILSSDNYTTITRCFRDAIELDPENAAAFAGLAYAQMIEGLWGRLGFSGRYTAARAAMEKALEINPELQQAKGAEAWLKMISLRDWQGARRGFDEILSEDPDFRIALVGGGILSIVEGRFQKASTFLLKAAQQDPLSAYAAKLHIWSKYLAGEYVEAFYEAEQIRISGRSGIISDAIEALILLQREEPGDLIERIELLAADSPHNDVLRGALGYACAVAGRTRRARELLDVLVNPGTSGRTHEPYSIALILIGMDRKQEAVQRLEQSYREGSLWSLGFPFDPILAPLRNTPYYRLFMSKASYPAAEKADPRLGFAG